MRRWLGGDLAFKIGTGAFAAWMVLVNAAIVEQLADTVKRRKFPCASPVDMIEVVF